MGEAPKAGDHIPVPAGEDGGASDQPEGALPQHLVRGRVLVEPLARLGLGKPELQNLRRLFPLAWPQSRACTLATLSSRLWSLSVRVLIFTVV